MAGSLDQSEQAMSALEALEALIEAINQSLDFDRIINGALDQIMVLFHCRSTHFRLIDFTSNERVVVAHRGYSSDDLAHITKRRKYGEGFSSVSNEAAEVIIIEDIDSDPRYDNRDGFARRIGSRSFVYFPILAKGRLLGDIVIHYDLPRTYPSEDIKLFAAIGHLIGAAIENAQSYRGKLEEIAVRKQTEETLREREQEAKRLAQENELIVEVGRIIGSTLNIAEVYERFSAKVREVLPFDRIAVNLVNRKDYTRTITYVSGDRFAGPRKGAVSSLAGTGLERAMRTKSSLLINGKDSGEKAGKFPGMTSQGLGAQSTMLIPLISNDEVFGALVMHSVVRNAYSEKDLRLAERVGSQIAGAIANAQLYQERQQTEAALHASEQAARRLAQESEMIAEIGRIIGSSLNIEDVYERFAQAVYTLIPIDRITINIINPQDNTATTAYVSGIELAHRRLGNVRPLALTLTAEVLRTRAALLINAENYPDYAAKFPDLTHSLRAGFLSLMAVPLFAKDEVIGVMQLRSTGQETYSEKDLKLAERVSAQIAGAIANAQLFLERNRAEEQLRQTFDRLRKAVNTTIQVLVSAVETRDAYTAGHQLKSADLARAIAAEMGLPPEKIDAIRMAASIHDIGKLSIPAEILSKPTRLSELEFDLIKEHARRGFEMLKDVESPWPLAEIVYQHHERLDGSGYPRQRQGEEILIEARVLAVADVVEAMSSHRPYRPALGIAAALAEIEKNSGIFYDSMAAAACLRLFREKGFKFAAAP